ncbi:hypothetical protein Bca101_059746 [Brassica carinata]
MRNWTVMLQVSRDRAAMVLSRSGMSRSVEARYTYLICLSSDSSRTELNGDDDSCSVPSSSINDHKLHNLSSSLAIKDSPSSSPFFSSLHLSGSLHRFWFTASLLFRSTTIEHLHLLYIVDWPCMRKDGLVAFVLFCLCLGDVGIVQL